MLVSRIRHTVYNKIAMQYRRFNRDKNWRTETVINGKNFREALSLALEDEEKRLALGLPERHLTKAKPKIEPVDFPSPVQLLPEHPQKTVEEMRLEIGSVTTRKQTKNCITCS